MEQAANRPQWVSLHQHTGYSLLDSSAKIPDLIKRTKELGMDSIAITDHGVMYGCVEFYQEAKEQGIKPIIGCEIYVVPKYMYIKVNDKENDIYIGYPAIVGRSGIVGYTPTKLSDDEQVKFNNSISVIKNVINSIK